MASGKLSAARTVRLSIFVSALGLMEARLVCALPGLFVSRMRWSEKIRSSAVAVLPLWKVSPWRSLMVAVCASELRLISCAAPYSIFWFLWSK